MSNQSDTGNCMYGVCRTCVDKCMLYWGGYQSGESCKPKNARAPALALVKNNALRDESPAQPAPNATWRHPKTGETYVVHSIRNTLADRPGWAVTVAYDRLSDGSQWSRPLSEWPGELEEVL